MKYLWALLSFVALAWFAIEFQSQIMHRVILDKVIQNMTVDQLLSRDYDIWAGILLNLAGFIATAFATVCCRLIFADNYLDLMLSIFQILLWVFFILILATSSENVLSPDQIPIWITASMSLGIFLGNRIPIKSLNLIK